MAFFTYPKPRDATDNKVTITEWQRMMLAQSPDGVTSGCLVSIPTPLVLRLQPGYARVGGFSSYSDTSLDLAVPPQPSGTRIDRLVLRLTWTGPTEAPTSVLVMPAIKSSSMGAPAPGVTQVLAGTWEISLGTYQVTGTSVSNLVPTVWDYPLIAYYDLGRYGVPPSGEEEIGYGYKMIWSLSAGNSTSVVPTITLTDGGATLNFATPGWYDFKGLITTHENISNLSALNTIMRKAPNDSWTTANRQLVSVGFSFDVNTPTVFYMPAGGQMQVLVSRTTSTAGSIGGRGTITLLRG